ncbi:MAG: ABC transporter permease [Bacilli bacterium]|nr:ABC transporter permease [Bacilli bacterium]
MNLLKKLVLKDLKLNKKRTIGTIVGVVLSCALIMTVGGMFYTLRKSMLQNEITNNGYYHIRINGLSIDEINDFKANRKFSSVIYNYNIGDTYYDDNNSFSGDIYSMDKDTFDKLSYQLLEGEFPKNENELLINQTYKYNKDVNVGDYIDVVIGEKDDFAYGLTYNQELKNSYTKKMKIVGLVNRYGDLITTGVKSDKYVVYLTLKDPKEYKEVVCKMLGVNSYDERFDSEKYRSIRVNEGVLLWEIFDFSDDTIAFFYRVLAVVILIIMVTSIFSIRNSFAISITEKLKTYGMLSSIGATKKQIRRMVLFEGFVVGLIGISLGVVLGIFVIWALCEIINLLAINADLFSNGFKLYYDISFIPLIIAIVSSIIVIFLFVIMSAIKASHSSPINNIRNADKIRSKKLKVPKFISKMFGIGGVLSYKNLKRSKKKYRVTIISLTVSIFVFITASSLVEYGLRTAKEEYGDLNYNIEAYGMGIVKYQDGNRYHDSIEQIEKLEKIDGANTLYLAEHYITDSYYVIRDTSKINIKNSMNEFSVRLYLMNDDSYKKYVEEIGGDYNDLKDKYILLNRGKTQDDNGNTRYVKVTNYEKGDVIKLIARKNDGSLVEIDNDNFTYQIGLVTEEKPIGVNDINAGFYITLVGNYDYFDDNNYDIEHVGTFFNSSDPYQLEKDIKEIDEKIYVENLDEHYKQVQTIILIISIIVYGFIIVVTLIGVTSVFNTINSNMALRSSDFATLKSIGMTKKEFNNMINLEAIFYSFKSLLYGTILGLIGSYIAYRAFMENYNFSYILPIKPIIISIIFIIILVMVLMRYSIKKINKQNIIETIRNNNI